MRYLLNVAVVLLLVYCTACSPNNVTVNNSLEKYFNDSRVNGTFGLLDNGQNEFTVYNLYRFKDSVYLPASSFDMVTAVIGLETGRISNENMVPVSGPAAKLPGDTVKTACQGLTVLAAFKTQSVPVFQAVATRIGKDTMQRWLDTLGYGTRYGKFAIKTAVDSFWLDNTLKITADEQLGFVKKLYFGQLPFQKRTQDIVKKMMQQQQTPKYKLSYKAAQGFTGNGDALGWVAGWIEENNHIYFFALNVEGPHSCDAKTAGIAVMNGILKQQGFFEGGR